MTVSRPDRKLRLNATILGVTLASVLAVAMPAFALQEEEQAEDPAAEAQTAEQTRQAREAEARRRYYLGRAPKLKRQMGPALGSPRSILPQPYVPRGSVEVPPPSTGASDATGPMPDAMADDGIPDTYTDPLSAEPDKVTGQMPEVGQLDGGQPPEGAAVPTGAGQTYSDGTPITAGELAMIDPSGTAVLGVGEGFPRDFWVGQSRAYVLAALKQLATPSTSSALNDAARKIALSGFLLPAPANEADVDAFVEARLSLLAAYGDHEGYLALLSRLPQDRDWGGIARHTANGYLLAGRIDDTCALASEQRGADGDPYWLRIAAFCRAVRGDRRGVDFQLGILEEAAAVKPTFYALLDQILIEAEQQPGSVMTEAPTLSSSLQVDVLEATMARLAKVTVPELSLDEVNPLAVDAMLSLPGVTQEAKITLMGEALQHGWISGARFAAFVRTLDISQDEGIAAFEIAETDDRFEVDVVLAALAASSTDPSQREAALRTFWQRSLARGTAQTVASGMLVLADKPLGLMVRAALLAGDSEAAARIFTSVRANVAGENPAADDVLLGSWPLVAAGGIVSAPEITADRLDAWWQSQMGTDDRYAHAGLLYATLEGLGAEVPEYLWNALDAGPVRTQGSQVAIGPWRAFLRAARNDDKAGALVAAYRLMGEGDVPPTLAGSLVGTLNDLGFKAEAHQLAAEILVQQGL
ncbi:hypothetical protein [Kordiimonas aestuarii]|uniref:hypothetical protein n=1 Tax=Kordiimonas aestuarii TaxID=1005925 RepID=UPI0021D37245|nr:hypothetical protein [Kordiimonas aestuarii]